MTDSVLPSPPIESFGDLLWYVLGKLATLLADLGLWLVVSLGRVRLVGS